MKVKEEESTSKEKKSKREKSRSKKVIETRVSRKWGRFS